MSKQPFSPFEVFRSPLGVALGEHGFGHQAHSPCEQGGFVVGHDDTLQRGEGFFQGLDHDHGFAPQAQELDLVVGQVLPLAGGLHLQQPQPMDLVAMAHEQIGAPLADVAEVEHPVPVGAQAVAYGSVVRVPAAVPHPFILVTLALALSNCAPDVPAGVVELANADRAIRATLEFWGESRDVVPQVFGVEPNPRCGATFPDGSYRVGFVMPSTRNCVGGYEDEGVIYMVVDPGIKYSTILPHELQHWLKDDGKHRAPGVWGTQFGGSEDDLVPTAAAFLRMFPDVDTMKAVE